MKRIIAVLLLAVTLINLFACGNGTVGPVDTTDGAAVVATDAATDAPADTPDLSKYRVLSKEDYLSKTTAAFLTQMIGVLSGYEHVWAGSKPMIGMPDSWFELCGGPYAKPNPHNKHADKLNFNESTGLWEVWNDDDYSIDILNQYILSNMFDKSGTVDSAIIMSDWNRYDVYDMGGGHYKLGARAIFKAKQYYPQFAGNAEYGNPYSWCPEPMIEDETMGLNCPGMPAYASYLCNLFSEVESDQEPVIWARLIAVMYSIAYFETDIETVIDKAVSTIPQSSVAAQTVAKAKEIYRKYPNDWRKGMTVADASCFTPHFATDSPMAETNVSGAFLILGLLYGQGDWYETLRILSLAGHGGESNNTWSGICAVMQGLDAIPKEALDVTWQNGEGVVVNKFYPDVATGYQMCALGLPEYIKMSDVVALYKKNFESILLQNGGFMDETNYYIPIEDVVAETAPMIENSYFQKGDLSGWTANGKVAASKSGAFVGKCCANLTGGSAEASISTTVTGLKVGGSYRLTAFVYTEPNVTCYLYAGADRAAYATVYDSRNYVKRELVFTATAETMEIGAYLPAGNPAGGACRVDSFMISTANEVTLIDDVVIPEAENGKYRGPVSITVNGKSEREVYLKIRYSSTSTDNIDAQVLVNSIPKASISFRSTAKQPLADASNVVYVPVILPKDTNKVLINIGSGYIYIHSAEVVDHIK
ncbi:MAG: hypothetical protein IJN63_02585 [Clostridia bacterium]|nr:hypothetical protein [Clostridia bacterium]